MSKLCISLPPFAPDYSGAASALFEMGGLIVLHDASGCTGNYTGFDEPRWFGSNSLVFCSGLRHMDAVLGNDDKFIHKIQEACKSLNPKFIAVLGSPVPMVIGTDFKGIGQELEVITGIPTIGIPTTGLRYYGKGIYDATIEMIKKFVKTKGHTTPNSINIIGMTPLDFYINHNHEDFVQLFEDNGISVKSCFYMDFSIEDLKKSVGASLNVVVSQAGIDVAKFMQTKFGIPYTVVTPIGDGSLALKQVADALAGRETPYIQKEREAQILIVGEQVISNSMRQYLEEKCGLGGIDVATLFDATKQYQQEGDITIKNELHLRKILNNGKYKTIIADPLIKQLLKDESIRFYSFPHVALSSKVHWHDCKRLMSHETKEWLRLLK